MASAASPREALRWPSPTDRWWGGGVQHMTGGAQGKAAIKINRPSRCDNCWICPCFTQVWHEWPDMFEWPDMSDLICLSDLTWVTWYVWVTWHEWPNMFEWPYMSDLICLGDLTWVTWYVWVTTNATKKPEPMCKNKIKKAVKNLHWRRHRRHTLFPSMMFEWPDMFELIDMIDLICLSDLIVAT